MSTQSSITKQGGVITRVYTFIIEHTFESAVVFSIFIILLLSLFRIGKTGTFTPSNVASIFVRKSVPKMQFLKKSGIDYIFGKPKKRFYNHESELREQENDGSPRSASKDSKGEVECRKVLQTLFKRPFNKKRPDFLRNSVTGNTQNLELDCFCEELKLAVEYNGIQHYKYIPFFHRNKDAFTNQKYRDELKRRMCKDHGIILIEVPYTVSIPEIKKFIMSELRTKLEQNK